MSLVMFTVEMRAGRWGYLRSCCPQVNNKARRSEGVEKVCMEAIILSIHGTSFNLGSSGKKVSEDTGSTD